MNLWRNLIISTLALSAAVSAQNSNAEGFYNKNQVRGFIAFKGDFRQLDEQAVKNINDIMFNNAIGFNEEVTVKAPSGESVTSLEYQTDLNQRNYGKFNDKIIGLNTEIGAQYHQFMTWFDINFMPTQISKKPKSLGSSYRDVKWFRYGFDWMFAWMLLQEDSPLNLIPAAGVGLSLQNFSFANNFEYPLDSDEELLGRTGGTLQNRYYSRFGSAINTQIELRFNLGFMALGAYAGARFVSYDDLVFETKQDTRFVLNNEADDNGNEYFVGGKLTIMFTSPWEKKQRELKNLK